MTETAPSQDNQTNSSLTNSLNDSISSATPPTLERKLSISEQASALSTRRFTSPPHVSWIERPFHIRNPTSGVYLEEATAQAMDHCARGPINTSGSIVGSAVLSLAAMQAGGRDEMIYGLKVSNLLSVGNIIASVSCGISMPFIGALVDHTSHRKTLGAMSAAVLMGCCGAQLMLSSSTWFVCYVLGIVMVYTFMMHQVCVMAYLPDLTHDNNEMAHYTAMIITKMFFVKGVYTSTIVAVSFTKKLDNLATAKLGVALAFVIGIVCFGYAWLFLFRKRPKLREIPEGQNLLSTGFLQLHNTSKVVFRHYHALKWFMISLLWSPEAGGGTVQAIAVTFFVIQVKMTVAEINLVGLANLFANIPGAYLSRYMCRKVNPLNSFRLSLLYLAAINGLMCYTVKGPQHKNLVYMYMMLLSGGMGWMTPSQRTATVALVPKGQETEIMGLVAFFAQILGWLPSLIFTIMNQNGVSLAWGLSLISFFMLLCVLCTLGCGDFNKAVAKVEHTSEVYLQDFARRSSLSVTVKDGFIDEEKEGQRQQGSLQDSSTKTKGEENHNNNINLATDQSRIQDSGSTANGDNDEFHDNTVDHA